MSQDHVVLTGPQRQDALDALWLSRAQFGLMTGWSEATVRRWIAGEDPPPGLDGWLWRRSQAMLADPPPVKGQGKALESTTGMEP